MPTFSELYPICLLLVVFLATGWLLYHRYPISDDDKDRDIQVDGLRGLLAFGVMTAHFFGIHSLVFNGEWYTGNLSKVISLVGSWPVPMFFGITAYLFGQRLIRSEFEQGRFLIKFLSGRCFRLIPTTLFACVLFLIANSKVYTDKQFPQLLIYNYKVLLNAASSSIFQPPTGPKTQLVKSWAWHIACGSHWTLHFEWIFYFSLVALSLVRMKKQSVLIPTIIIMLLLIGIQGTRVFFIQWDYITWAFIPGLILGVTCIYWKSHRYLRHPFAAMIAIAAVIASAFDNKLKVKIPANTIFLAVILSNNTATRLLESKLLRSLGETTYSIYLLHGIVQYITLKWFVTLPIAGSMPEWLWWLTCALQVVVIVVIARLTFEFVEKPGIEAGKRFYSWLMNLIELRAKWLLNWI
jgi:peptidoglycan/LPS O-acetylase OafA/YrhL